MFAKINAIILLVADAPKLVTFYRDVVGMEVRQESEEWVEMNTKEGSTVLVLYVSRDRETLSNIRQDAYGSRNMLIGFNVSDLNSVCEELDSKGIRFHKKPTEEFFGRHAIIEDPEGNLISIAEMKIKDEYKQISYYHGFAPE